MRRAQPIVAPFSRGIGVSPMKSTFALRRNDGTTIDAQMLNMRQVLLYRLIVEINAAILPALIETAFPAPTE
jgi:hypothetical protein